MNKSFEPKRSAASWLVELAKGRYGEYALSVLAALLGVACSLIPYFIIIRIITALVNGMEELSHCLILCAWMSAFWILRYVLHSLFTSLSHHATFYVLARTRTRLLDKLATLPLVRCWTVPPVPTKTSSWNVSIPLKLPLRICCRR